MITVPPNAKVSSKMMELIKFFNQLEEQLQYPNSEGYAEQAMYLQRAETELIKWGKI